MSGGRKFVYALRTFSKTIWLLPVLLTIALLLLTALKINGSSIGTYYSYFYGSGKDPAIVLGKPRPIRSDEWLTNTQMTIAQSNNNYQRINQNVGQGEDTSIVLDVPYKDWSEIFRPQNWSFFVLPFDYAFAFKWWLMGYLLILSSYFFVLTLLPRRIFLAILLSLGLFFSAFVQWWYQYITLGPLYYSLGIAALFIIFVNSKKRAVRWGAIAGITYLMVCFALVLYPPFQIPCALVVLALAVGYILTRYKNWSPKELLTRSFLVLGSLALATAVSLLFLFTRHNPVKLAENTVYPGHRITQSGDANLADVFSGNLDLQLQFSSKAAHYVSGNRGITNQSESSNFVDLLPFLLIPSGYFLWLGYKSKDKSIWPLAALNILFLIFLLDLFVPRLNAFFKLLLLGRVPHERLVIGLGLLNLLGIVLTIRFLSQTKRQIAKSWIFAYSILVLLAELLMGLYTKNHSPGFIGDYRLIAFALPIPIAIFLLLNKKYEWALSLILLFSIATSIVVNPIYRGTAILTDDSLSKEIKGLHAQNNGRWISEDIYLENFAIMNGAPSLSGLYTYPQLNLWRSIDQGGTQQNTYNRYAHVDFLINRSNSSAPAQLNLIGPDHFDVITGACSQFLEQNNVKFIMTDAPISSTCSHLVAKVVYPARSIFIYKV